MHSILSSIRPLFFASFLFFLPILRILITHFAQNATTPQRTASGRGSAYVLSRRVPLPGSASILCSTYTSTSSTALTGPYPFISSSRPSLPVPDLLLRSPAMIPGRNLEPQAAEQCRALTRGAIVAGGPSFYLLSLCFPPSPTQTRSYPSSAGQPTPSITPVYSPLLWNGLQGPLPQQLLLPPLVRHVSNSRRTSAAFAVLFQFLL
ncbi:hypothetical protein DFH06DRAFT_317349 [Mycena polygramma]|nr:hypothetical protein DFH06DRAFT_317349 [Mycena polygramma]